MNKLLTAKEIEEAWGDDFPSSERVVLNRAEVPNDLYVLIPYAEIWGIADDWKREHVLQATPNQLKENLKAVVLQNGDLLDAWLAGPEATSPDPSDAYVAFSAMRMAADFA